MQLSHLIIDTIAGGNVARLAAAGRSTFAAIGMGNRDDRDGRAWARAQGIGISGCHDATPIFAFMLANSSVVVMKASRADGSVARTTLQNRDSGLIRLPVLYPIGSGSQKGTPLIATLANISQMGLWDLADASA